MTELRTATCVCGDLRIVCDGEPARVSICGCRDCQKRTGSAFGVGAYFAAENVQEPRRAVRSFTRKSATNRALTFYFCDRCGSTVYWRLEMLPGMLGVAVGAFADSSFPAPQVAVWTTHKAPWVVLPDGIAHHPYAAP
jgi:hypothetical protein